MLGLNFQVTEMGKWQAIYWNQGPEAAKSYCDSVVCKLSAILESTIYPLWMSQKENDNFKDCNLLKQRYEFKINKYQPDVRIGERIWSTGRNEPGRTPLNYPDFRHQFNSIETLNKFLDQKIKLQQDMLISIESLLKNLPSDLPQRHLLESLKESHIHALKKWQERKESSTNSPSWILPPGKDPLNVTCIDWAHQNAYFGENANIIVIECGGADVKHPALLDNILQAFELNDVIATKHGTHVCGIIAGRKNESNGHSGGAPCAKIQLASGSFPEVNNILNESPISIVNFSGDFPNPFSPLVSTFDDHLAFASNLSRMICNLPDMNSTIYLMNIMQLKRAGKINEAREKLQALYQMAAKSCLESLSPALKGKLLINAIGNDGVMITESPYFMNSSPLLEIMANSNECILVANAYSDGCTLSLTSNLPGDKYADSTICAVGKDVLSCLPGAEYGKLSGTSMAAPFVSSVALLLKSAFPGLDNAQIRSCILESATPIILDETATPHIVSDPAELNRFTQEQITFSRKFFGRGLLNAKAAIALAKSRTS